MDTCPTRWVLEFVAVNPPFLGVFPAVVHHDVVGVGVVGLVEIAPVADIAIVVGNDGPILAAAFVFTSSVGVVGIAPEVGIAVVFRFDSTFCGFDAIEFDNGIDRFADETFHTFVQAGTADSETNETGQEGCAAYGDFGGHNAFSCH